MNISAAGPSENSEILPPDRVRAFQLAKMRFHASCWEGSRHPWYHLPFSKICLKPSLGSLVTSKKLWRKNRIWPGSVQTDEDFCSGISGKIRKFCHPPGPGRARSGPGGWRNFLKKILNHQIFEEFYIFVKNDSQTHFNGKPEWGMFYLGLWGASKKLWAKSLRWGTKGRNPSLFATVKTKSWEYRK